MLMKSIVAATSLFLASVAPVLAQQPPTNHIPEPESLLLFGAGLAAAIAFGVIRRRK